MDFKRGSSKKRIWATRGTVARLQTESFSVPFEDT